MAIYSSSDPLPITNGTATIGTGQIWARGYRGEGTKIAIIDAGFNIDDSTLATLDSRFYAIEPTGMGVGTYDVAEGEAVQGSQHGTSCAIIAGDVAPTAELYLLSYTSESGLIGWLCALDYAVKTLKVDVVSTSVEFGYPTCHADGTGPLNQMVDQILNGTDTTLVIAAGNWAEGSGADRTFYGGVFTDSDGDFQHDFTQGVSDAWDRNTLLFSAHEGDQITVVLEWDDWDAGIKTADLDLILYDADYKVSLAVSQATQYGNETNPVEILFGELPYTGDYCLAIVDHAGKWDGQPTRPVSFHLNMISSNGAFETIEHHTVCGSVREVATNPAVITVGAVSVDDGTVRSYSSRGPTAGGVDKPDIYAPDGVTGTVYPAFYGTSASAPYVAGAIALLRSVYPDTLKGEELSRLQGKSAGSTDESRSGSTLPQEAESGCSDSCGNPMYQLDLTIFLKE